MEGHSRPVSTPAQRVKSQAGEQDVVSSRIKSLQQLWGDLLPPEVICPYVRFGYGTSLKDTAITGSWTLTQILVEPPRVMTGHGLGTIVRVEHMAGLIPGGRSPGIVRVFRALTFQDQGSPLSSHLGYLETDQRLFGKRHQQVTLPTGRILG